MVWDLGLTTLPPRKFIPILMVDILYDLIVGNIHQWFIHTKEVHILHNMFVGRIAVLMMVMVEVVLVLG